MYDYYKHEFKHADSVIESKITKKQLEEVNTFDSGFINGDGNMASIREGGSKKRNNKEKSMDNVRGKIAEFAVYNWLKSNNIICSEPTIWVSGTGVFDSGADLVIKEFNGKKLTDNNKIYIEIKSSSLKAGAMLLEKDRWIKNENNEVINHDHSEDKIPDVFISVNVSLLGEKDYELSNKIFITGMLSSKTLKYCVKNSKSLYSNEDYIPTASVQNSVTKLDAPNYVFPYHYKSLNNKYKDREQDTKWLMTPHFGLDRLKRDLINLI